MDCMENIVLAQGQVKVTLSGLILAWKCGLGWNSIYYFFYYDTVLALVQLSKMNYCKLFQ